MFYRKGEEKQRLERLKLFRINVLYLGRKAKVEIEKTKTVQKKQLISEFFTTWYQLKEMENKLETRETQHRKRHSGEKSRNLQWRKVMKRHSGEKS